MEKAWYLEEYEEKAYLHNKTLILKEHMRKLPEHDHCELCWARFSDYPEDHHIGYYEPISSSWICPECVQELSQLFGWNIELT